MAGTTVGGTAVAVATAVVGVGCSIVAAAAEVGTGVEVGAGDSVVTTVGGTVAPSHPESTRARTTISSSSRRRRCRRAFPITFTGVLLGSGALEGGAAGRSSESLVQPPAPVTLSYCTILGPGAKLQWRHGVRTLWSGEQREQHSRLFTGEVGTNSSSDFSRSAASHRRAAEAATTTVAACCPHRLSPSTPSSRRCIYLATPAELWYTAWTHLRPAPAHLPRSGYRSCNDPAEEI